MPKVIREDRVYEAALSVFLARGYEKATTKEISEAAGINETTLFRKYGSKAGLLKQALQHLAASTPLDRIRYTGDLEGDLVAITEAYLQTSRARGELIPVLLAELPRYPELREVLEPPLAILRAVGEVLEQYQNQGLLRREPILMTTGALMGPLIVTRMMRLAGPEMTVPEADPRQHVALFLRGRREEARG